MKSEKKPLLWAVLASLFTFSVVAGAGMLAGMEWREWLMMAMFASGSEVVPMYWFLKKA